MSQSRENEAKKNNQRGFLLLILLSGSVAFSQGTVPVIGSCDASCQAWVAQMAKAAPATPMANQPVVPSPSAVSSSVQTAATAGPVCPTFIGGAASYAPTASPKMTGDGFVATLFPFLKCNPNALQAYSYSEYAEAAVKVNGKWTLQQTITSGVAIPMRKLFWNIELWMIGTAGPAIATQTSTVTLATTYGPLLTKPVKSFLAVVGYEKINGGSQVILGFAKQMKGALP